MLEQWEFNLRRLKDKIDDSSMKVQIAYVKMRRDPNYDSYPDIYAASGALGNLVTTIEDIKEDLGVRLSGPRRLSIEDFQEKVEDLLEKVEDTRQRMLQVPGYNSPRDIAYFVKSIDDLYDTLADMWLLKKSKL